MPPKTTTKEKVVKGDEAEEMVLQYLRSVNRPYASTDVSANLKNKVPKAAAQKILLTLAEKGSLTCKTYGKQTIFVYNQAHLSVASSDDLAGLDTELKNAQSLLEEKRKQLKVLQNDLSAKMALPKTKQLGAEIDCIKAENDITLSALLRCRGTSDGQAKVAPMPNEEINKIDDDFTRWRKQWTDRRKVCKEILGMLQDGGQVIDTPSFEDDQGISPDDEDAKYVECGEFCQPVPPRDKITPKVGAGGTKRSVSGTPASEESRGQRQKSKRV